MKRFIVLLALAVLFITPAFAMQGEPIDWLELVGTVGAFGASLSALAAAVVALSELIVGRLLKWDGLAAWLGTFVLTEVLAFGGWKFGVGFFATLEVWWSVAIVGFAGTLLANRVFSTEIIQRILEAIGIRIPSARRL